MSSSHAINVYNYTPHVSHFFVDIREFGNVLGEPKLFAKSNILFGDCGRGGNNNSCLLFSYIFSVGDNVVSFIDC
jgi:hypothetical protein